jgi:serine/threonine protein phosphatase PrpC
VIASKPERRMILRLSSSGATHVGRRRSNNEDAFLCDDAAGLWLVADGVGGRAAGEVASQTTVEAIQGELARDCAGLSDAQVEAAVARRMMERAVQAATYFVFGLAELEGHTGGMGTTVSALAFIGGQLVSGQVGDSRIYRLRQGQCSQLTDDHTWVNWQVRSGRMTEAEAARSPKKNVITRAVGHFDYVEVDTATWDLEAGDRFLLCSDGLHGYLQNADLPALLRGYRSNAVNALIELANERGGRDNITAVVLDVEAVGA